MVAGGVSGSLGPEDGRLVTGTDRGDDRLADGGCGARVARDGVRLGSAAGGATDVAGATSGDGVAAGELVPIVDNPGPAGSTGAGGPAR